MWMDCPYQTCSVQWQLQAIGAGMASNDPGIGSGWQPSKHTFAPPAVMQRDKAQILKQQRVWKEEQTKRGNAHGDGGTGGGNSYSIGGNGRETKGGRGGCKDRGGPRRMRRRRRRQRCPCCRPLISAAAGVRRQPTGRRGGRRRRPQHRLVSRTRPHNARRHGSCPVGVCSRSRELFPLPCAGRQQVARALSETRNSRGRSVTRRRANGSYFERVDLGTV